MSSNMIFSEKEREVHSFSADDISEDKQAPKFYLVAHCLSNSINSKTFIKKMGEFWSNKILSGEPWHYFNQLILRYSPVMLQSVTKEDLGKVQLWVQIHRLPFLSKSRALDMKVGEWMGEYIDVYEESLHEVWGRLS
ncbi:hypothetical protein G4B88_018594 [Cannabis sativa]|uniref:DUF4283 domain-containing protein n=1 Tax=Cannabis sativa TaxID=3483 RepID=A0A7J6HGQ2_CANSA|nr:hypothetical protein G4B88_018594 [Cannabis sativa]